ncbi:MAG: hypothetical protein WDZ82_00075 [Candidatus Paceibacterota bacterium]
MDLIVLSLEGVPMTASTLETRYTTSVAKCDRYTSPIVNKAFILLECRLALGKRNAYFAQTTNEDLLVYHFVEHCRKLLAQWFECSSHYERWVLLSVRNEEHLEQLVREGEIADHVGWFSYQNT